ncbi:MAG TPA: hypothetical protein H9724_03305 [Candidatus Gemmiger avistercoris]|uniref:Uncharacterized protein n=1 Tax=Candidatus Gemmiger avistercoris TaxID=2838606 RepID=A0A9D2FJZ1_9FIRM|nr:hypothetical protein [Candidatus Gemmiger avistercoris]
MKHPDLTVSVYRDNYTLCIGIIAQISDRLQEPNHGNPTVSAVNFTQIFARFFSRFSDFFHFLTLFSTMWGTVCPAATTNCIGQNYRAVPPACGFFPAPPFRGRAAARRSGLTNHAECVYCYWT